MTPSNFLADIGWSYQKRGKFLSMKYCPFCDGGQHGDSFTFIVHASDGNYSCQRSKCGASGSFWSLIESQGREPREYIQRKSSEKKKRFVYGRQ